MHRRSAKKKSWHIYGVRRGEGNVPKMRAQRCAARMHPPIIKEAVVYLKEGGAEKERRKEDKRCILIVVH